MKRKILSLSLMFCVAFSTIATAQVTTTSTTIGGGTKYVIVQGDTLGKIAAKYNTTYQELANYNGISNPHLIYTGDVIYINSVNNEGTKENTTPDVVASSKDYSGVYVGYSWRGENSGTAFEDATQRVKTTITLDENGVIQAAEMDFLKKSGDDWIKRDDDSATVEVDFTINPTFATLGDESANGSSMFDITTNDMMSLYVTSVDEDGTVAYGFVDPITRYLYEAKFGSDYDYDTTIGEAVIGDTFVPTVLTSSSGYVKPKSWEEFEGKSLLDLDKYSYVSTKRGVYESLSNESTVKELLEKSGVEFVDGKPQQLDATHGFHSAGGWTGNYEAIEKYLVGKNAMEVTALANFDGTSYAGNSYRDSINEDNFFGYNTDTVATATKSLQQSWDAVTGATVRISRENTSYQRALVEAGILSEKDVIKGRF